MIRRFTVHTRGRGLHPITRELETAVRQARVHEGLCTVFVQHSSASLVIQENADPSAAVDLERYLDRLVPDADPIYTHTTEGPDDMSSHVKAALTQTSLGIPVVDGHLALGTWQGVFLWEHRRAGSARGVVVHVAGD